jgi:hypothetical protein
MLTGSKGSGAHLKLGLGIGLGVGLALLCILLALVVFLKLRRNKKLPETLPSMTENYRPAPSPTNAPHEPYNGPPGLPDVYKDYSMTGRTMNNTASDLTMMSDDPYGASTRANTPMYPLAFPSPPPQAYTNDPVDTIPELGAPPIPMALYARSSEPYSSSNASIAPPPSYYTMAAPERARTGRPERMHSRGHSRNLSAATSTPLLNTPTEEQPLRPYTRFRN